MTVALQLSVFDQTLSEVGAAERLASLLGHVLKLGRLVSSQVKFVSRLAQLDPHAFTTTQDVWGAAESLESKFFRLYAAVYTIKSPPKSTKLARPAVVFDKDLARRLVYMRELMGQRDTGRRVQPNESRQREQSVLDDLSVPPEVRRTIRRARCLPVLMVFAHLMHAPTFTSDTARELVRETTRECVDNMIAFLLGAYDRSGIRPVAPPDGLELPAPMPLDALEKRWQDVQATWADY